MFLALWNYLQGYVIIRVSGFSTERFVNMASYRGIYMWDMDMQEGFVYLKVSISGFKMLKECAKKTGCHFEIIERQGLPFLIHRYRKRKILTVGIFAFVIFIYVLSSFVWKINVEGNERISDEAVIEALDKEGISPGTLKFKIDTKYASKKLIEEFSDISWVSVTVKGTDLFVKIAETIEKSDIKDNSPCDIVAKKDAIIESIAVSSGTPLVKQGDVIYEGDVLVSGELILKDGEEEVGRECTASEACVFGKIWYEFYNQVSLNYTEKVYTGNTKTDTYISLGDVILNIISPDIKYENFDTEKVYEKNISIGDYKLPISIVKNVYREYRNEDKKRSEQEAKDITEYKIEENIFENDCEGDITEKNIEYILKDGILCSKTTIAVIERIDEKRLRSDLKLGTD